VLYRCQTLPPDRLTAAVELVLTRVQSEDHHAGRAGTHELKTRGWGTSIITLSIVTTKRRRVQKSKVFD
jgi:hypothetical protein